MQDTNAGGAPALDTSRIEALFDALPQRHEVLLGMMRRAERACTPEEMRACVDGLQSRNASAFEAATYEAQLEEAGALARVDAQGAPVDRGRRQAAELVEEDGEKYWRPAAHLSFRFQTTSEGRAFLASHEPGALTRSLLNDEPEHAGTFLRVLNMCSSGEGLLISQINEMVGAGPDTSERPLLGSYFVERLERCGALAWDGSWKTTAAGMRVLAEKAR